MYFKFLAYFMHDVLEANSLTQGLEPPTKPASQPAPKAAKPRAKPSTKSAAKLAAKPAARAPIPVAPFEHVQLFKVKYSCQKKWHQEPVYHNKQFLGQFVVHMPLCPLGHWCCASSVMMTPVH